jgi:predicted RNA-binding protein YlxR (DUF448 family)
MTDIYVGAYLKSSDMDKILDRWVFELNNKLSLKIREIGRSNGIAKSRKKRLLRFFLVTTEEYEQLINPASRSFYLIKHNVDWEAKLSIEKKAFMQIIESLKATYEESLNNELKKAVKLI